MGDPGVVPTAAAQTMNKTIRALECALRADKTGLPVGSVAVNGSFIVSLLIIFLITVSAVSAKGREDENGKAGSPTDSQQLKEKTEQTSTDKDSKDSSKQQQPGKRNAVTRDVPVGAGDKARPDGNINSRMRNVDRINRSFDGSMKNISNSVNKMKSDINKIRTLDRRDRRF